MYICTFFNFSYLPDYFCRLTFNDLGYCQGVAVGEDGGHNKKTSFVFFFRPSLSVCHTDFTWGFSLILYL